MNSLLAVALVAVTGAAPPADTQCAVAHDVAIWQPSPCTGVLMPLPMVDQCIELKVSLLPRLKLKLDKLTELRTIDAKTATETLAACDAECNKLRLALKTVASPPPPPWYKSTAFVATVSAIAGVALGAVVVHLAAK